MLRARLGDRVRRAGGDPSWPPAKEYVAVPDDLLEDTCALVPYVARSYEYALSLKLKPTRKRPPK